VLPVAAAGGAQDALIDLFVVLLAAKLGEEACRRLNQPAILGEILAGIAIGPSILGLVEPDALLEVFAELGVVFLLFRVGLESRLAEMREVGGRALRVGVLGVAVPFVAGFGLGQALGEGVDTNLFLGAALMATSAGIAAAVLREIGPSWQRAVRTILGAAVVDDILALILLSAIVGISGDGVNLSAIGLLIVGAVVFVGIVAVGGSRLLGRYPTALTAPAFSTSGLLPAVLLCLGLAAIAGEVGLATIIGGFLAGMIVAETKGHNRVEEEIRPLHAFFPPFFFAYIGIQVDLSALSGGGALALLAGITALAVLAKLLAGWVGAAGMERRERQLVAFGMVPRGEVGIVVAGIGSTAGVIDAKLFAAIVGMALLTTFLTPPVLRRLASGEVVGRDRVGNHGGAPLR
jgi:Kef-type K+ transport system membrane component KefB